MQTLMELACGKTSFACSRYLWPSVRSRIATPITPSRPRSISPIEFSSFCQRACCFSDGGAAACGKAEPSSANETASDLIKPSLKLCLALLIGSDFGLAESLHCGLGGHGGVVNLLEGIRLRLGIDDGQNLDV